MRILAIDPGPRKSAYVVWNTENQVIEEMEIYDNGELICIFACELFYDVLVIEKITLYQKVNNDVHDTIVWYGRFLEACDRNIGCHFIPRSEILKHFCPGVKGAGDSSVRAALIDRLGKPGRKDNPGITYGVKYDLWQALAVAIYWQDKNEVNDER